MYHAYTLLLYVCISHYYTQLGVAELCSTISKDPLGNLSSELGLDVLPVTTFDLFGI